MLQTNMVSPKERHRLLNSLCKMCGVLHSVPKSMVIPRLDKVSPLALFDGGFADVYQGECEGRLVAVKTLRLYAGKNNDIYLSVSTPFHSFRKKLALTPPL